MTISLSKEAVALKGAEEMLRVTKMMSAWTEETSLFPAVVPAEKPEVRVYRVAEPREVYVERNEVVGAAHSLLGQVGRNEVRKLVAGTGTGKSTLLPVSLVMTTGTLAIVVMPNRSLAKLISVYVKESVCVGARKQCGVDRCIDYEDVKKLCAPAVAYMAASDFLMMLASDATVLDRLRPSFVYVDEAHEKIPQYEVLQLLVSAGKFAGTKVFLGSATSSSQNLERRDTGVTHVVKTIAPRFLMYDHPEAFEVQSPMHHSVIQNRTLVFVPTCEAFPALVQYYQGNALEVLEIPEWASASQVQAVERSLKTSVRPVVVLLTQKHQTGYTFSAETVIDCGITVELAVDCDDKEVKLVHKVASEAESIQRCGRVGRFISGLAYTVARSGYEVKSGCSGSNECYVALWCKLLGLKVDSAAARKWASFVQPMSMYKVCLLLSATIHPVVLSPFIASDGTVYRGTREIFLHFLRMQRKLVSTAPNIDVVLYTKLWQEQIMVVKTIEVEESEFKTQYTVPAAWTLWSYVMYHALLSGEVPLKWFSYTRNVASTLQDRTDGTRSVNSSSGSLAHSFSEKPPSLRRDSGYGAGERDKLRREQPTSPLAKGYVGSVEEIGRGNNNSWEERPQAEPDEARTRSWVKNIDNIVTGVDQVRVSPLTPAFQYYPTTPPRPTYSGQLPSYRQSNPTSPYWATRAYEGQGSPEQRVSKKKKRSHSGALVSATIGNLSDALLEPAVENSRVNFLRLIASYSQTSLYKSLKSGEQKISMLNDNQRQEAFYCVLVMWNDAIATQLQLQAKPDKFFSRKEVELAKVARLLDRAKLLLKAFDVYGYTYRHQKYRPQSGVRLDLSEVRGDIQRAEFARTWGNDKYRESVALATKFSTSLYVDGVRVGAAYKDGAVLFTALHLWSRSGVRPREFELSGVAACADIDSGVAVVNSLQGVRLSATQTVKRRAPVVGEAVSLFVPLEVSVVPVGFYTVLAVGDVCIYDANVPDGVSGSPLVAHIDGCVIGIHLGALAYPDGSVYSQFASVDAYTFE